MKRLPIFLVILCSVMLNACFGPSISGSGHVITETRNPSDFSSVSLEGSGHVLIEQGGANSVTVTSDDNLLPDVKTEVRGGTLVLGQRNGVRLSPSRDLVFKVTVRKLEGLSLAGSGDIEANGIQSSKIKIDLGGSGEISAAGAGDDLEVTLSGSGQFHGDKLKSKRARVDIAGSGGVVVAASDVLDATIGGSGSIEYIGAPQVHQSISGSGSIRQR